LGYPRRALRLREAALASSSTPWRRSLDEVAALLERLPGIGTYTARAVAAFAFQQRQPVVDNVPAQPDFVWADRAGPATTKADCLPLRRNCPPTRSRPPQPRAAFMEIGALLCTAGADCNACPLRGRCAWLARNETLPSGPTRRPQSYAGQRQYVRGPIFDRFMIGQPSHPWRDLDRLWVDSDSWRGL
jgi:A/G-specific adenine glycosylase